MNINHTNALILSILVAFGVLMIFLSAGTWLIWHTLLYWLTVLMWVLWMKAKRDNGQG